MTGRTATGKAPWWVEELDNDERLMLRRLADAFGGTEGEMAREYIAWRDAPETDPGPPL